MGENMNEKLKKILSGMGSDKLKNSADIASKFLSTKEGQKLKESLSEADKKAILNKFMSLDSEKAREALNNVDFSKLDKDKIAEIMNKLKKE